MIVYTVKRWDAEGSSDEITNRLECTDFEINWNYSQNTTSNFTLTYSSSVRRDILEGDFLYAPEYRYVGIIKSYDSKGHKIVTGDILNIYQYPMLLPNDLDVQNPPGTLLGYLNNFSSDTRFPELKAGILNWTLETGSTNEYTATLNFGTATNGAYNLETFWTYASKVMQFARSNTSNKNKRQVKGLRITCDGFARSGNRGSFNMTLTETKSVKTDLVYEFPKRGKEKPRNRFITDLSINDNGVSYNSVILWDKDGKFLSRWYLDFTDGSVSQTVPPKDQWPVYTTGHVLDVTAQNAPTEYEAAVAQLPSNLTDNFSFVVPRTQQYLEYEDVMVNTNMQVTIMDSGSVSRVLNGTVSTLKVTADNISVTVGMERPRLKLNI